MKMIVYAACGLAAGFLCGCLGTGGGIVVVFTLTLYGFYKKHRAKAELMPDDNNNDNGKGKDKDIYANTVAAILPMTVVSAFIYGKNGSFQLKEALIFIIPAIVGGFLGAFLLERLKTGVINKVFAFLVIFSGIMMLLR